MPLRVEIGARDLADGAVTVVRRDTGDKQQLPLARVAGAVGGAAEATCRRRSSDAARDERERRTLRDPGGYDEAIEYLREAAGFVAAPWCGGRECEARVKEDSSATIRCLPLDGEAAQGDIVHLLRPSGGGRGRLGAGVLGASHPFEGARPSNG